MVAILLCFGAITGVLGWTGGGPASGFRHLYLLPTLWAALRFGGLGGGGGGLLAALLYAPFVLPGIESRGVTAESVEGLISLGLFLFVGSVAGSLVHRARLQAARYRLLLGLQRTLSRGEDLRDLLADVAEKLHAALAARAVAIVLVPGGPEPLVVWRGEANDRSDAIGAHSVASWVLRDGHSLFVGDLESDHRFAPPGLARGRPRRLLLVPLSAREGRMGVLAVERGGEFPRELRATVETLGLQLALGIENRRLADRQRRFAEELEGKVAAATRRLRELDRAKSDFVSIVSHELRTPLTSIQGFSELLLTRPTSAERAQRFLGSIHREAERLGRIVADLLDLSRIESGRESALLPAPLELGPLIDANVELFRDQSRRHTVERDIPVGLPLVLADHDAVDRVLKNLLSNAIRYSPRGGPVRIWARGSAGERRRVELGVEDQGVGIPAAALPGIFEKYSRVPHPDTGHVRGLGIGLALVKSLVEAQGGDVRAESELGVGSCFIVTLPIASPPGKTQSA
ncbi:MAG: GAF domain-containing protein [Candidatus Rokubacteria bacterium]|nr:GAF domain-containing protein [Candidatus Rokubacteria bacterium]